MKALLVEYPKCTTCQKAERWLEENGIDYESRSIVQENPTAEELREWHKRSGLAIKRFINTSGLKYKSLGLKDRLPGMSEDEIYALLATDGMLVRRPILVSGPLVLPGFKPQEWAALLG